MREWIVGAFINLFGSIAINFGTNLLKLGHNERERYLMLGGDGSNGKLASKPIIYFQTWRTGLLFFALGNCFNFVSFGYAAQSLLAALGSIQFVSNIAFSYFVLDKTVTVRSYFVLDKTVTVRVLVATVFIVLGNTFLVAFGNHQSPVYTPEQLAEKFSNTTFLFYCLTLIIIVVVHHMVYKRGEELFATSKQDMESYWHLLLPFSYATVSGAIGSCSVLFAKSLSNLLRLSMSSNYQLHGWFSYFMLLLFFSTAGFWMARLNEGLSLFDAILIVPMFQIAWTFFSIYTGFVYFQEYQVFDRLRTTMFILGMVSVFLGISLLAPDDSKSTSGVEVKETALESLKLTSSSSETERIHYHGRSVIPSEDVQIKDIRSFMHALKLKVAVMMAKTKAAISVSVGLGDHSLNASAILVMPMVSSKPTSGFRGNALERGKALSFKNHHWSKISLEEGESKLMETTALL